MTKPTFAAADCCIHFTGLFAEAMKPIACCGAGVDYRATFGGERGIFRRMPCRRPGPDAMPCDKRELPTADQVEAWDAYAKERLAQTFTAIGLCAEDAKTGNRKAGTVECPACKGRLSYAIASRNGHMWGRCETADCLGWMQ